MSNKVKKKPVQDDKAKAVMKWLEQKKATETEVEVYKIIVRLYNKTALPIQNGDVSAVRRTNRTGTLVHLNNLVKKKIIKKHSKFTYIPNEPE